MSPELPDSGEPARPKPYRRVAALVVLVAGAAAIASTVSQVAKEPVAIHIRLAPGMRALRMDIRQRGSTGDKLVEHIEWSYPPEPIVKPTVEPTVEARAQPPAEQDASLELPPGHYAVTLRPVGAGHDPGPVSLDVEKGAARELTIDLRAQ